MSERFMTPEQAAELMGIHPRTLRKWLHEEKIRGVKVGRLWRIPESEVAGILTPSQAAERLAISPKTVRGWLRSGKLKGMRIGGMWWLRVQDLDDFLKR